MGPDCLTLKKAWAVYDRWLNDPKVEFHSETADVDGLFRRATARFGNLAAPKALGDCYLAALSRAYRATLVSFDAGLSKLAVRIGQGARLLA
jgi:predicted nucleic acid-binding protein